MWLNLMAVGPDQSKTKRARPVKNQSKKPVKKSRALHHARQGRTEVMRSINPRRSVVVGAGIAGNEGKIVDYGDVFGREGYILEKIVQGIYLLGELCQIEKKYTSPPAASPPNNNSSMVPKT
jgi:hypothetical protein